MFTWYHCGLSVRLLHVLAINTCNKICNSVKVEGNLAMQTRHSNVRLSSMTRQNYILVSGSKMSLLMLSTAEGHGQVSSQYILNRKTFRVSLDLMRSGSNICSGQIGLSNGLCSWLMWRHICQFTGISEKFQKQRHLTDAWSTCVHASHLKASADLAILAFCGRSLQRTQNPSLSNIGPKALQSWTYSGRSIGF